MAAPSFLYLASRSPRRRELLNQAGVPFRLLDMEVDETVLAGESAVAYVERLARNKATKGWRILSVSKSKELAPVLAADTTVALATDILGKPESPEQAVDMLMQLQGQEHTVHTGVALCFDTKIEARVVTTMVRFGQFSQDMATRYVATGEPMDKAGAYGIQGFGGVLVAGIEGSYSNVVGLPVQETVELARLFNVPFWQQTAGS
ncbi:Maf family protein [Sansalvadorimonas verongulae]|uniref:Maf family protein n=1 Tax=Sansalvadorimonas verongulae TaxID=2172824 RepID=UPI0012BD65A3|nr:nucleoside triphosphate pyrophosphatase [Sansalvadorimonas verongulae]MTI14826.1 septum formation inhibitor Maf [Sansalvadorimonas verongulae]